MPLPLVLILIALTATDSVAVDAAFQATRKSIRWNDSSPSRSSSSFSSTWSSLSSLSLSSAQSSAFSNPIDPSASSAEASSVPNANGSSQQTNRPAPATTATNTAPATTPKYRHALGILAMPCASCDRIANEVIINTLLPHSDKISLVLRCEGTKPPSLARLRQYVGEVYSQLWDCVALQSEGILPDVVVYPQNLPNTAPESWIDIQPDLEAVCSHDSLIGWFSEKAGGRGALYQSRQGMGGLQSHVQAMNAERLQRQLGPVVAVPVDENLWPDLCQDSVVFVDDEPDEFHRSPLWQAIKEKRQQKQPASSTVMMDEWDQNNDYDDEENDDNSYDKGDESTNNNVNSNLLLGGARLPSKQQLLFNSVCVGGTFDGLHFGHRKLLTLAVSSVNPFTGRLLVGVTVDEMLQHKEYAEFIPDLTERCEGVRRFLHRLAPGMMNRVKIVPIRDTFGPPGQQVGGEHFDALVCSHETLSNAYELNRYRQQSLGFAPLKLLCTRRTEAQGMSSTALRRLRSQALYKRNDEVTRQ